MKKFSLLFFIILSSCGRTPYIEPELIKYLNRFEKEINYSTENIAVVFTNLDAPTIGVCTLNDFSFNFIQLDRRFWESSDEYEREQLIYHELGHCAMFLEHNDTEVTYNSVKIPGSIMNSTFFGDMLFYKNNAQKYKDALKNKTVVNL